MPPYSERANRNFKRRFPHAGNVFPRSPSGEALEPVTVGFALAVLAVVFIGRRMPVGQPRAR
ncbi:MAG: hypothetical protein ING41_07715 [Burkholderiales bacterium]|jgi:hypothetical protein|nr:hypothetical protein [Burkholderiales bacterium]